MKLFNDSELINRFIKLKDENEIYEFCLKNGAEFSKEELIELIKKGEHGLKRSINLMKLNDLNNIVGGKKDGKFFMKSVATAMAALSLGESFNIIPHAIAAKSVESNKIKRVKKINQEDDNFISKNWAKIGVATLTVGVPALSLIYYFGQKNGNVGWNVKNYFSGISNHDSSGKCLNRCYINSYIQMLHQIPAIREFINQNKNKDEVFRRLNSVFLKMDNLQPIAWNDEDYSEFCKLVGHTGEQRSYDNVKQSIDGICLKHNIKPSFNEVLDSDSILLGLENRNIEELIKDKDNFAVINIERASSNGKNLSEVEIPHIVKNRKGKKFKLTSMIIHHGNLNGGHYATVKRDKDNNWWYLDDNNVILQEIPSNNLNISSYVRKNAVTLYYSQEN